MKTAMTWLLAATIGLAASHGAAQQPTPVQIKLSNKNIVLGESVSFVIVINNSTAHQPPDLSALLSDFAVTQGRVIERSNSANGRRNTAIDYSFSLTPMRIGRLTIPAIAVTVDGKSYKTPAQIITVNKSGDQSFFDFSVKLAKAECYVGEPVLATFTHRRFRNINGLPRFAVPTAKRGDFSLHDKQPKSDAGGSMVSLTVGDTRLIGNEVKKAKDGREYIDITFYKILIPHRAGIIRIPAALASANMIVEQKRSRDPFDSFFGHRRNAYKSISAMSKPVAITVKPIPTNNRPDNFSGLVGQYSITAEGTPNTVSIGDPITMKILISGSPYLDNMKLPALKQQKALASGFKIPQEMAAPEDGWDSRQFTQTIRATRSGIESIPSITLAYFNTAKGEYSIARTEEIPLTVKKTRVLTANDGEGLGSKPAGSTLEAWSRGIAHNYEGEAVLANHAYGTDHWFTSPAWISVVSIPPALYFFMLAAAVIVRHRNSNPATLRARKAHREFCNSLANIRRSKAEDSDAVHSGLLDAIRTYLGARLFTPSAALTFNDVEGALRQSGVSEEAMGALQQVFEQCEASSYAGGTSDNPQELLSKTKQVIVRIERTLRR